MDTTYKYVGTHANYLLDGRPVAPGRVVDRVNPDDPLVKQGLLIVCSTTETEQDTEVNEPEETVAPEQPVKPASTRRRGGKDTLSDSSGK